MQQSNQGNNVEWEKKQAASGIVAIVAITAVVFLIAGIWVFQHFSNMAPGGDKPATRASNASPDYGRRGEAPRVSDAPVPRAAAEKAARAEEGDTDSSSATGGANPGGVKGSSGASGQ